MFFGKNKGVKNIDMNKEENAFKNGQSNRIAEIDIAKGLGMIFVVYAHIVLAEPALTVIYSFQMPLFFILSGMVMNVSKYSSVVELFKNKFKKMMLPYYFFCILGVIFVAISKPFICYLNNNSWNNVGKFFLQSIYSIVWAPYSLKYFTDFNTPMWFVPCLLLVELMYYIISRAFEKNGREYIKYIVILLISILGWIMEAKILPIDFSVLPWNFSSACFCLGFFALGDLLGKNILARMSCDKTIKSTIKYIIIFAISSCAMVFTGLLNGKISIGSRILNNGLLLYASGILGTISIVCLARLLNKSKLLKFIGKNSFTIMGCHIIVYHCVAYFFIVVDKLGKVTIISSLKNNGIYYWASFEFVISLALSILFAKLYNIFLLKIKNRKNN